MIAAALFALSITVVSSQGEVVPSAKCVNTDAVVRCSAPSFEPVDVPRPAEAPLTVVLPKSRAVTVHGVTTNVVAEWHRPDKDGLVLLARRNVPANGALQIDVAEAPRVLTFVWPDGARTSTFVAPAATEATVVKPATGSEVVAWLGMRSVRPVRLQLQSGDVTRAAAVDRAGLVSVSGVAPGAKSP